MDEDLQTEFSHLEERRCRALMDGDIFALSELLADDLVHVHGNGEIEGKESYLDGVRHKYVFQKVARGPLTIRAYGDVVVVTGTLEQRLTINATKSTYEISAVVTQTWVRHPVGWKQNTCHNAFVSVSDLTAA